MFLTKFCVCYQYINSDSGQLFIICGHCQAIFINFDWASKPPNLKELLLPMVITVVAGGHTSPRKVCNDNKGKKE